MQHSAGVTRPISIMAERNNASWIQAVSSFCASPQSFLSNITTEDFLDGLLKDLTSEAIQEQTKVLMLSLLEEFPNHLCPDQRSGEDTSEVLMNMLKATVKSGKNVPLRCHLLLAIETVLITTDNFNIDCRVAQEFASMLMHIIADVNDIKQGPVNRPVRATACECLRELETCCPGFLSERLETFYYMHQQEMTYIHQSYTMLYTVALKNAVYLLAQRENPPNGTLKTMLTSNKNFFWKATDNSRELRPTSGEQAVLVASKRETKELKSVLSCLLEDSFLLTPICQNTMFWQITQLVSMIRTVSPGIFKSQLIRLFGTMDVSFFHSVLQMKAVFTDSLFTAEDEHFLLQRLVVMTQHPLLGISVKLFYLDCLLHFPENRPLNSNPGENLPVLLTVQMTSSLFPNVFNDGCTMLSRQNLLSMLYLENEGFQSEKGIGFLFDHLLSLYKMVHRNGNREITSTFFRAVYLFVRYFNNCDKYMDNLMNTLLELYGSRSSLAPYFINLINESQVLLEFHSWPFSLSSALQKQVVRLPVEMLNLGNLGWHLQILARVAQEHTVTQKRTVSFLKQVCLHSGICQQGDWRSGNAILSVCKNLLQHQQLDSTFMLLADLLQYLMHHFEDIDIQDHARLYYVLLTNVSIDKLTKMLTMSPAESQSKARSLSSIMTQSENSSTFLTIHNAQSTILQLCLIPKVASEFPVSSEDPVSMSLIKNHFLDEYYEQLTGQRSRLTMKYHLAYKGDINPTHQKLFCIALQFELTDESSFEPLDGVTVPCLILDREPTVVAVKLVPKAKDPRPSVIRVSATYSTQDGFTHRTSLEPLQMMFPDLFLPLPSPPSWLTNARAHLFDRLWLALQPDKTNQCEESTFCCDMSENALYSVARSYFSDFVLFYNANEYKIGIYLPPRCHILMQVIGKENIAQFVIRTDNWNLLPFLNSHLLTITSQRAL
uniref:AP-5 complex subunit beta-1 n=1 Tax=Leptobrachium leishanense TaxID=445787 RepID=A0A8C5MQ05_9ANUR